MRRCMSNRERKRERERAREREKESNRQGERERVRERNAGRAGRDHHDDDEEVCVAHLKITLCTYI